MKKIYGSIKRLDPSNVDGSDSDNDYCDIRYQSPENRKETPVKIGSCTFLGVSRKEGVGIPGPKNILLSSMNLNNSQITTAFEVPKMFAFEKEDIV